MLIVNALIEKQHFAEAARSLVANVERKRVREKEGRKRERKERRGNEEWRA